MLTKYALWDVDNCIADDKWRAHLIDWSKTGNDRYEVYNSQMFDDPACNLEHFEFMCGFTIPIFLTGRVDKWEFTTRSWMAHRGFLRLYPKPTMLMRSITDRSKPADLKQAMLHRLFEMGIKREDIIAAFDDVPAIVEMYQAHGIPARVLRINDDFSGIYEPRDLSPVSTTA